LRGWKYDEVTKILQTSANESIWKIAENIEKIHHNPLWHRFIGLPGSIGGAIYGNAGCFGLETESNFLKATVFDMEAGIKKYFDKSHMEFSYRHSMLKEHPEYLLVSATFDLSKKIEKYHSDVDNIDFRENKQPKGNSCGSFFKNPSKEKSAGMLIESVGLKGHKHGGAMWSDLHANFLISDPKTCTGQDLYELVMLTQEKVKKEHGISLVNEVKIVKN
jgi:UDP-N-acetylmuramate dehydrogenase